MSGSWLFLAAYACSGLAGLIYEVSWTRLVTLYMGHTTAVVEASQGKTDEARAAFQTALRLGPRDPATYTNLALLELSSGHAAVAAGLFAESLLLDPLSSSARQGLADAQHAIGGR